MKKLSMASLLALITACAGEGPQSNQNESLDASGIRQGKVVSLDNYLSQSTVAVVGHGTCSGTLIADGIVVTAAHCIQGRSPMFIVLSNNASDTQQVRAVDMVAIHPDYIDALSDENGPVLNRHDIALLHFQGDSGDRKNAEILEDVSVLKDEMKVTIAGYGVFDDSRQPLRNRFLRQPPKKDDGTGTLRFTEVPIAAVKFSDTEVLLDQQAGSGACKGDSGGPAYANVNGQPQLVGITSWGPMRPGSDSCGIAVVYTLMAPHMEWVEMVKGRIHEALNQRQAAR